MYVPEATVWFYFNYYIGVADALQCYVCTVGYCVILFNYYIGVADALQCYVCAGGYCMLLFKLLHRCDRRSVVLCMC